MSYISKYTGAEVEEILDVSKEDSLKIKLITEEINEIWNIIIINDFDNDFNNDFTI